METKFGRKFLASLYFIYVITFYDIDRKTIIKKIKNVNKKRHAINVEIVCKGDNRNEINLFAIIAL